MTHVAFRRTHSVVALCVLTIFAGTLQGQATTQGRRSNIVANTVSVASLATPAKAREHLEKARRAMVKGHEDEYQRELAAALAVHPGYAEAYLLRASHELLLDRYPAAAEDALTAQRLEPSIHWATVIHAIACNQLKRFDEASTLLDGLGPPESDTWQAIFERTRAAVGTGDTEAALHWSERALAAVPEDKVDDTVLLRGDALLLAHRWGDAIEEFKTYLRSPRPQPKRNEVLAMLERIPELARQDPAPLIAQTPQ